MILSKCLSSKYWDIRQANTMTKFYDRLASLLHFHGRINWDCAMLTFPSISTYCISWSICESVRSHWLLFAFWFSQIHCHTFQSLWRYPCHWLLSQRQHAADDDSRKQMEWFLATPPREIVQLSQPTLPSNHPVSAVHRKTTQIWRRVSMHTESTWDFN